MLKMNTKLLIILVLVSQLVFADKPDIFLLKTYDDKKSVIGWVMSEKLDGVRGFWDGKQLLTRGGNKLNPPAWFVVNYPPFAIDGELWTKRGDFENIVSIVRTKNPDNRWRKITHQIFEIPKQKGGLFERLTILQDFLANNYNTPIKIIKQIPISRKQQLNSFLNTVIQKGGEGVVVRDPSKPYQTGRLDSALKVKRYQDAECVVIEILPGKGKYYGKMGSLLCKMLDNKLIKIGSGFKDSQRQNPPLIGTKITFKYYGLTKNGKPKYASFLRIKK